MKVRFRFFYTFRSGNTVFCFFVRFCGFQTPLTPPSTRLTINENGRILKYTRMNAFYSRLTKTEDLYKTKNGPNRQSSTQKVSVDFSLKDVPVKRNANASKSCKYKSYNLINAQKSEGKLIEARNDIQGHNDTRENFLVNKTPAEAFTPPAEKKIGAKWAFMSNCSGREHEKWLFKNI